VTAHAVSYQKLISVKLLSWTQSSAAVAATDKMAGATRRRRFAGDLPRGRHLEREVAQEFVIEASIGACQSRLHAPITDNSSAADAEQIADSS